MAKPFYSMDEVCAKLGKTQDDVRAMVRDGSLREFRDAGKVFFRAEDVDKFGRAAGGSPGDSGEIVLESAEDELPSLGTKGGTSIIGLEPADEEKRRKEGTHISTGGVGVFDADEVEIDADPLAKTHITTGATDQVALEGTGSGSGLLDLTREADDTSLGAELLDEIYPGEEEAAKPSRPTPARVETPAEEEAEEEEPVMEAPSGGETLVAPIAVGDPTEGMFGGLLVGALIPLGVAASVVAGALQGFVPSYGLALSNNFLYLVLGAILVPALALLIGWFVGRAAAPRRG
ncbi:MAG: hypothetical protein U1D55_19075 [Phycisphaerae bacterium]